MFSSHFYDSITFDSTPFFDWPQFACQVKGNYPGKKTSVVGVYPENCWREKPAWWSLLYSRCSTMRPRPSWWWHLPVAKKRRDCRLHITPLLGWLSWQLASRGGIGNVLTTGSRILWYWSRAIYDEWCP